MVDINISYIKYRINDNVIYTTKKKLEIMSSYIYKIDDFL